MDPAYDFATQPVAWRLSAARVSQHWIRLLLPLTLFAMRRHVHAGRTGAEFAEPKQFAVVVLLVRAANAAHRPLLIDR